MAQLGSGKQNNTAPKPVDEATVATAANKQAKASKAGYGTGLDNANLAESESKARNASYIANASGPNPVIGGGIMVDTTWGANALQRAADQAGRATKAYDLGAGNFNMGMGPLSVGGGQSAADAQAAGRITGRALIGEAQGIQKQLDELREISTSIRNLGVSEDVIKSAERNLLALAAGDMQHLDNPSFGAHMDYVTEAMSRRLSPHGYAPGEHAYGDNIMANTIAQNTLDYTKWWGDHNRNILGYGNQLAGYGVQGLLDTGRLGVEYNPAGLAWSAFANVGQTSMRPNTAVDWWNNQRQRVPELQGLLGGPGRVNGVV